jgi:hypothetical protein|tara:strand:- start:542 stop:862 length:321 start_codon:yes stop_codon:yes gene_type:complete
MASYVLFYSEDCKYCREALQTLNNNQLTDKFDLVDVLKNPLPAGVTSVPTVYEKITCNLSKGAEVFNLIEDMSKSQVTSYEFGQSGMGFTDLDFTKSSNIESFSWI